MKSVLDLSAKDARAFFLKSESYCRIDLPPYFTFDSVLSSAVKVMEGKSIKDVSRMMPDTPGERDTPKRHENVNYLLFGNKDGGYGWRPLQIIHPILYVDLVNHITSEENWKCIRSLLQSWHAAATQIECLSMPVVSESKESDAATQISSWWENVEQKSIALSLDFSSLFHTDISNCYGSLYTHSIAWALDGSSGTDRKERQGKIGAGIDWRIQAMSYGQSNGIPQGSVLMDFIAEIVLSYIDTLLQTNLSAKNGLGSFRILRYRDDYRIFTMSPRDGEIILKELTEILSRFGFSLNSQKTRHTEDVIKGSLKQDKLYLLSSESRQVGLQKKLLNIYILSTQFPNSGTINRLLTQLYKSNLLRGKDVAGNIDVLVGIITNIALKNPRVYPITAAILSKLLSFKAGKTEKETIVNKILVRFGELPNTAMMGVWLQRLSLKIEMQLATTEKLCLIAEGGKDIRLWNSDWLDDEIRVSLEDEEIVNRSRISSMDDVIPIEEVELFKDGIY